MIISIHTLFPQLYDSFLQTSLIKRAQEKKLVEFCVNNLFLQCSPGERVDAPTFGHGAGVLIKPAVIEKAVNQSDSQFGKSFKIFFSPHGKKLDQRLLKDIYQKSVEYGHCALFPARYEGMDARVEEEYADIVISLGDFVLMGGDLPAMVFIEGMLRYIPGVVGKAESVESDSFSGPLVDYPEYTEPIEWMGRMVPEIIRSGDHKKVRDWRQDMAARRTVLHHFEWARSHLDTDEGKKLICKQIPAHYAVLMHSHILLPGGLEGTSSVTSIDMHDIARSAKTYGLKKFFIVTPLEDQKKIVAQLLQFWQQGPGIEYNNHRHEAMNNVVLCSSLEEVIHAISLAEHNDPYLIATSAKKEHSDNNITYYDQDVVWAHEQPVLFVFGTAHGLAPSIIKRCQALLVPLEGLSQFNHLSVRSAVGIIFDRWLGISPKKMYSK
ncbi:MAG: RNA methyltransferase [Candidatus Babeliaceae bacterium]|jgi:tRNA (guanine37-N1)-methyltransferase